MKILLTILLLSSQTFANTDEVKVMPNTCNELLPDVAPYIELFDQTAQLWTASSPQKAKKMFDLLALRTLYQETTRDYNNPVDWLLRDALCECSSKYKGELFNSGSMNLRTCMSKNIDKFVKKAEKEYIKLKLDNYKKDKMIKLGDAQRLKVQTLKAQAKEDMKRKTNAEFERKIR